MNDYSTIPLKRSRHDGWYDADRVRQTTVYTPHGMVNVMLLSGQTSLTMVSRGKLEQVLIWRKLSETGAIRKAVAFAKKKAAKQ